MKTIPLKILGCFIVGLLAVQAHGQIVLTQGQSFLFSFNPGDVPLSSTFLAQPGYVPFAQFSFAGSFLPGTQISYEMFENSASEAPLCSGTMVTSPETGCSFPRAWQDGQGALRFTMLSASGVMDSIRVGYQIPLGSELITVYAQRFVPVPEPSAALLMLAGIALAAITLREGGVRFRRGVNVPSVVVRTFCKICGLTPVKPVGVKGKNRLSANLFRIGRCGPGPGWRQPSPPGDPRKESLAKEVGVEAMSSGNGPAIQGRGSARGISQRRRASFQGQGVGRRQLESIAWGAS